MASNIRTGEARCSFPVSMPKEYPKIESGSNQFGNEIYQDLDPGAKEIRLLEVQPGTEDEPVCCKLERVSLLAIPKPVYETISYVWGDKTKRGTIQLHGRAMDVPVSSEVVLRRMRLPAVKRVLWLDAVCINQEDSRERSQQVAFMNEIYANGSRNLIWLGEDDRFTEAALADIRRLVEDMRVETNDFADAKDLLYNEQLRILFSDTHLGVKILNWPALEHFYLNPWFSRLWVVQEAAMSQRNVCYQGNFEFALEYVLKAVLWLCHKAFRIDINNNLWTAMYRVRRISYFTDRENGFYNLRPESEITFLDLIHDLTDFEALDSRDHVFGILGLVQRYTKIEEIPASLSPNYAAPLSNIFRDASRFSITDRGDLMTLNLVNHRVEGGSCEWPSWVARWDWKFDNKYDAPLLTSYGFASDKGVPLKLPLLAVNDPNILPVEGLVVDSIEYRTPVIDIPARRETSVEEQFVNLINPAHAAANRSEVLRTKNDPAKAVGCTLIASKRMDGTRMNEGECAKLYRAYRRHLEDTSQLPVWPHSLLDIRSKLEKQASEYKRAMLQVCPRRCFFSTLSGFLGLGPPTVKPGDIVAVLFGGALPFILRPVSHKPGATHELVGQCYVHGIMDGEAVEAHQSQGKEIEIFYLG